ncbi:Aspartyl-tRNA(Asn) amidotransferase subunit A amidotransferase subunit A [Leucobacter sp. 7(1)]|uniref:amidase n=1 Tax=Leucobacter sp. 7(1) TaxID=1255613 RepID=UPI00097F0F4A|nr:amidase [Leucobacter sp. 7(1)]SJN09630.1 Aspartyl-tRNA(Asn) amidotransferase subunit A amidotransferase subunit A [Leucobacter sp. 7(1)]
MSASLSDFSAHVLRAELRAGTLSAREVTEHFLDRIAERADLGAFITITAEQARAAAAAADERFAATPAAERGRLPALHGIPLAHKDLTDVGGAPTTHGSAALPHTVAQADAPGVHTLRGAGAISLGKTQVPEFGLTGYSENLIAPPARNPLDPERTAGGSSGGSAAAVAAGLLPFAPGSDGGGSIRIPALACGLVGLKPGLGAIPSDVTRGVRDEFGAPRLTVTGPIAHTAQDAALLFDAMRGSGKAGSIEPAVTAVARAESLRGLRVGISDASPFASAYPTPLSPEARAAHERAAQLLSGLGHVVEDAAIHYDPIYPQAFTRAWTAGLSLLELPAGGAERLTPLTRLFRERALARSAEDHAVAAAQLHAFAAHARAQWARYDVVLTPGLAMLPPRIGAFTALSPDDDYQLQCEWAPYTSMVNVSGLPAIAVPILTTEAGHSFGVQLIGRPGTEETLLQLAAQLLAS